MNSQMLFIVLLVIGNIFTSALIPSIRQLSGPSSIGRRGSLLQTQIKQRKQLQLKDASIFHSITSVSLRNFLAVPVMYSLMSINEYITHRYYQHAEFNKNTLLKKVTCFFMGLEQAPKVKGGGHIEHHAETYDDMTLKNDARWRETPAAKSLDADTYRGTAFTWKVMFLMMLQMLPTAIPTFTLMGFSFLTIVKMIVPSIVLHGLIWNALHPAMHGLEDVPAREGPPSWLFGKFVSTPYFKFLYKNHQGHHVVGGQGNYNVCCPGTDHLVGSFFPESVWAPMMRPKPIAADNTVVA